MFAWYFPSVVTDIDATSHIHDWQYVIVWVSKGKVRSICMSEPVPEDMLRQRCYKARSFDPMPWKGKMKSFLSEMPMVRRMHIDDDPKKGYALYPVGSRAGSVAVLETFEFGKFVTAADNPPCIDYDKMTQKQIDSLSLQPLLKFGITIPFANANFTDYIMRAMSTALDSSTRGGPP